MAINNKWARGVSIIGGGMTRMGNAAESPWLKGMSERDLMTWAVLEACEDAGIEVKDIDATCTAQSNAIYMKSLHMGQTTNHMLGLEGKPGFSIVMACAGGVGACQLLGNMIASGQIDIGLVVSVGTPASHADEDPAAYSCHPGKRVKDVPYKRRLDFFLDRAYVNPTIPTFTSIPGFQYLRYAKQYGITADDVIAALNQVSINMRDGAINHPKSMHCDGKSYHDLAKENGLANAMEYLADTNFNPSIGWPLRKSHFSLICEGASALVLCATDIAKKISRKPPIEISGIGFGSGIGIAHEGDDIRYCPIQETGSRDQCYTMAGITDTAEIDFITLHDPFSINHITDAEFTGYIKPGEAWKYILDGETRFDGKKPMQTHGGCVEFGDSNDAAAIADIFEAVQQMRGECGARQIPNLPKLSVVVGRGAHSIGMMALRNRS